MRRAIILKAGVAVASSVALFAVACGSFRDASTNEDASVAVSDASVDPLDSSQPDAPSDATVGDAIAADAGFADSGVSPCVGTSHIFCDDFDGDGGLRLGGMDAGAWDRIVVSGASSHRITLDRSRSAPRSYLMDIKSGGDVLLETTVPAAQQATLAFDLFPETIAEGNVTGALATLTKAERVVTVFVTTTSNGLLYATVKDSKGPLSNAVPLKANAWNHVNVVANSSGSRLTVEAEGLSPSSEATTSPVTTFPGNLLQLGYTGVGTWLFYFDNVAVDLFGE